jgi:hypothetical protein
VFAFRASASLECSTILVFHSAWTRRTGKDSVKGRMDTHFTSPAANGGSHHLRFHLPHRHLTSAFGNDWFALKAEAFARFFGTPFFLIGQTLLVAVWIFLNATKITHFDLYPSSC